VHILAHIFLVLETHLFSKQSSRTWSVCNKNLAASRSKNSAQF